MSRTRPAMQENKKRAGPVAEERQDDQEGPDDKIDENKQEGARTGRGQGGWGSFFFPAFLFIFSAAGDDFSV